MEDSLRCVGGHGVGAVVTERGDTGGLEGRCTSGDGDVGHGTD